jgi:hypothetical protein
MTPTTISQRSNLRPACPTLRLPARNANPTAEPHRDMTIESQRRVTSTRPDSARRGGGRGASSAAPWCLGGDQGVPMLKANDGDRLSASVNNDVVPVSYSLPFLDGIRDRGPEGVHSGPARERLPKLPAPLPRWLWRTYHQAAKSRFLGSAFPGSASESCLTNAVQAIRLCSRKHPDKGTPGESRGRKAMGPRLLRDDQDKTPRRTPRQPSCRTCSSAVALLHPWWWEMHGSLRPLGGRSCDRVSTPPMPDACACSWRQPPSAARPMTG